MIAIRGAPTSCANVSGPILRQGHLIATGAKDSMNSKRIQAITGDEVVLRHPSLDFERTASASVSVIQAGVSYHVLSLPPGQHHDHAMVTGEYSLNGATLRVREVVDSLQIGASAVRFENIYEAETGTLKLTTHNRHDEGLELLSALQPTDTPLGIKITAPAGVDVATAPNLLVEAQPLGVLQITPLTSIQNDLLPEWQGTAVDGGELFAGNISRTVPYLILVTPTARVDIMNSTDIDRAAELASQLHVTWTP